MFSCIFKEITKQTSYLLVYEILQLRIYTEGIVLYKTTKDSSKQENNILDGLSIIKGGQCVVKNPLDNFEVTTLVENDIFGESKLFGIKGYDYFGDIIVKSEYVKIWFISQKHIERIPKYDIAQIKMNCIRNESKIYQLLIKNKNKYDKKLTNKYTS